MGFRNRAKPKGPTVSPSSPSKTMKKQPRSRKSEPMGYEKDGESCAERRRLDKDRERCAERRRKTAILMEALRKELAPLDEKKTIPESFLLSMAVEFLGARSESAHADTGDGGQQDHILRKTQLVALLLETRGHIVYALPPCGETLGVAELDLIGHSALGIIHAEDRHCLIDALQTVQGSYGVTTFQCRMLVKSQEHGSDTERSLSPPTIYHPFSCRVRRVKSPGGRELVVFVAIPDVLQPKIDVTSLSPQFGRSNLDGLAVPYETFSLVDLSMQLQHMTIGNTVGGLGATMCVKVGLQGFCHPDDMQAASLLAQQVVTMRRLAFTWIRYQAFGTGLWRTAAVWSKVCINRATGQPTHIFIHQFNSGHDGNLTCPNRSLQGVGLYGQDVVLYNNVDELIYLMEDFGARKRQEYDAAREAAEHKEELSILAESAQWQVLFRPEPTNQNDQLMITNQTEPKDTLSIRSSDSSVGSSGGVSSGESNHSAAIASPRDSIGSPDSLGVSHELLFDHFTLDPLPDLSDNGPIIPPTHPQPIPAEHVQAPPLDKGHTAQNGVKIPTIELDLVGGSQFSLDQGHAIQTPPPTTTNHNHGIFGAEKPCLGSDLNANDVSLAQNHGFLIPQLVDSQSLPVSNATVAALAQMTPDEWLYDVLMSALVPMDIPGTESCLFDGGP